MKIISAWLVGVVVLIVACGAWVIAAQQKPASADVLLGQALHQEQNEGRVEDAIAGYKKVLAASDAMREQKARAQVRIGACYERLGTVDTRKAYEAVVANYGDQADFAKQASERLAALGVPSSLALRPASARLIWSKNNGTLPTPTNDGGGVASPDGKSLVYTSVTEGDGFSLQIYDMASGTSRRLTPSTGCTASGCDMSLNSTVWSHDGARIAYAWSAGDKYALRLINADGTAQRTLSEGIITVADWSPGAAGRVDA